MSRCLLILLALILTGCETAEYSRLKSNGQSVNESRSLVSIPMTNLGQVKEGMTLGEVKAIMGDKMVVGFEKESEGTGDFARLTIAHPYRIEEMEIDGQRYYIAFYYTQVKTADDLVAEDELTPLIFKDDQLVSIGADALFELRKKDAP